MIWPWLPTASAPNVNVPLPRNGAFALPVGVSFDRTTVNVLPSTVGDRLTILCHGPRLPPITSNTMPFDTTLGAEIHPVMVSVPSAVPPFATRLLLESCTAVIMMLLTLNG